MFRPKLFDDSELISIVDDVLGCNPIARVAALKQLRCQVELYVTRFDSIRLGLLGDDKEVRRDIFMSVMATLEANNFARLGAWRARRLNGLDRSSFWGLVRITTYHRSIDYDRAYFVSVAPRLTPSREAGEETPSATRLEESLPERPFLADCTAEQLYEYLDLFQSMYRTPGGVTALPVPDLVLPEESATRRY
jgi:hypothetical protein